MENLQELKEISLEKDEKCGYGFSIIGGRGSELPPIIFDVIHNSPADKCVDVRFFLMYCYEAQFLKQSNQYAVI